MQSSIGELILRLKGERTYEQLSKDCGGQPSQGRIQQMTTKHQTGFPSVESIRGLAKGLGVKPAVILAALGKDFELLTDGDLSTNSNLPLPEGSESLTSSQHSAVVSMVRELVKSNELLAQATALATVTKTNGANNAA